MASGHVLIIDNDRDIAEVVCAVLSDEGYRVSVLADLAPDAIAAEVGRLEPDCVLLDGASELVGYGYGESWAAAARLAHRDRPVPVIMFTAQTRDVDEARDAQTTRSRAAALAGVIPKPFELEDLVDTVARAAERATPFDGSPAGDAARSEQLASALEGIGARDVRMSTRREWATFKTSRDRLMQVYWWQGGGQYLVGRYDDDGRRMDNVAYAFDRARAIEICQKYMREDDAVAA